MEFVENVKRAEAPPAKWEDNNRVFVPENIRPHSEPETDDSPAFEGFIYDMKVYGKDEYARVELEAKNALLETEIVNTQLALAELYEGTV
jgi:hypothetical protein